MEETHPEVGDVLNITGVVHKRPMNGMPLPNGFHDESLDGGYIVEVVGIKQWRVGFNDRLTYETLTLRTEDGNTVDVNYRGREKIAGRAGQSLEGSNTTGANQSWTWEKVEA